MVEPSPPILEVCNLRKSFGAQEVLRGIDLCIPAREVTVIIGASGSGKSVLLKHLQALLRPDAGEVRLHGRKGPESDPKLAGPKACGRA